MRHKDSGSAKRMSDVEVGSTSGGSGVIDASKPLVSSPQVEGGAEEPLETGSADVEPTGETSARNNTVAGSFRRARTVDFEQPVPESPTTATIEEEEDEPEQPMMSMAMTVTLLVIVTVVVAVTAEFLVDSIDGLVDGGVISKEFVGLILLPIVGNAAGMFCSSQVIVSGLLI